MKVCPCGRYRQLTMVLYPSIIILKSSKIILNGLVLKECQYLPAIWKQVNQGCVFFLQHSSIYHTMCMQHHNQSCRCRHHRQGLYQHQHFRRRNRCHRRRHHYRKSYPLQDNHLCRRHYHLHRRIELFWLLIVFVIIIVFVTVVLFTTSLSLSALSLFIFYLR